MNRNNLMVILGCIVIAGGCFLAYSPAIKGPFLWDDHNYITNNELLSAPDGLWRIWFSTDVPSQYFPFVYTTFRFEYQLWGLNPIGYHVDNIILHIISALLLWLILRRLSIPAAFVAAAAFALHPVNVESVAWITQRKNTLMLVFALLSVFFYIELVVRSPTKRRSVVFYLLSLFCFALSLFSKTTACVLPLVLILILWLKEVPLNTRRLLQVAPYFVMGIAMGLLTMWWEKNHQGVGLIDLGLTFPDKLLIASRAIWFYAGKIFWPLNLAFSYPRWKIDAAEPAQYVWLLVCFVAAGGLFIFRKPIGRAPVAAILFFAIALFPMLGFFTLYTFLYSWAADHYAYMGTIGLITLAVGIGSSIIYRLGKMGRMVGPVVAAAVLIALGILTWRQAGLYSNPELIWRDTLKKNPDSWLAHNNLGLVLITHNKLDEAIVHLSRSLELVKDTKELHPHDIAAAHFNLALIYRGQNKFDEAIEQFEQTVKIDPNDFEAQRELAMTHYQWADVLSKEGNVLGQITQLHRALDVAPGYVDALQSLVGIFVNTTDPDTRSATKIIEYAKRAVATTNSKNPLLLNLLAMVYAADNQFAEAYAAAEKALALCNAAGAADLAAFIRKQMESYEKQLK
jgi:tetratricopeptide (TPR) repeat protein